MAGDGSDSPSVTKPKDGQENSSVKAAGPSLVGVMRGCVHPFLDLMSGKRVLVSFRRSGKRARKILRTRDEQGKLAKRRKNIARVRFKLPKSKTVHVIQPFESDSIFIRRWRHFMAGPLCYEVWAFPFRLAFGETGFHSIVVADMLCDAMFLLSAAFKSSTVVAPGTLPDQDEPIRSFSGIFGVYLRRHFLMDFFPMVLYYIVTFTLGGNGMLQLSLWWLATVPRMFTRGRQLLAYFGDMSNDLQVNARILESVKFALIIILSSHWVGCLFYWLARIMSHNDTTWVHEFQLLLPLFDKEDSPLATKYLLCLYKGFNAFSNLGYDYGIPRNWVEMVYSLLVMGAQVYLSALILGTLLNYLVRNNPAEEQHKQTIAALTAHVEEKNIPAELRDRMLRHFNFQHKKNLGRNAEMLWFLPKSLTVKVAYHKFQSTMDKCALEGNAFHGCERAFLDDCLSRLKVMHFTPGELLIKKGDLPRELYMVVEGALVMMDDDNRVVTVIRADVPDMPPYANIAPFMIGVHYHHPLIAGLDGECTTLILTKEEADALFAAFPAERERIRENILATYGLLPNGEDLQLSEEKRVEMENSEWAEMREPVRHALKSQRLHTLADFEQAVDQGDTDKLRTLISKGVSVNLTNYDGRTGLHVACFKGHATVVEMLLELQADPNLRDRWGRTPLLDAIHHRQKAIVGLLEQADVNAPFLQEKFMKHATRGRVEKMREILEVGGLDINAGNYDARTALHFACACGHEEAVDQILRAKGDINAKDRFGGTPLKDAVVSGHSLLATILRTRGGVLPDGMGTELLCTAAGEGDIQTLKLLFESQENMNTGDYDARCALHLAAAEARILAVSFLLTHTADPNCEDRWGGRPMDDALRGGTLYHLYCGKLIQSWGGKPGTLADDEEKIAKLDEIRINDALAAVQRLTALGFDKRRIERIGEQELLATFESCMGVIPMVEEVRLQAELLADCVEETSECVSSLFEQILTVIENMSKRLSPNAGPAGKPGTTRDLKKTTRVNMWEKVRQAKDSNLLTSDAFDSGGGLRGMPRNNSGPPDLAMLTTAAERAAHEKRARAHSGNKDESASLTLRCEQLQRAMKNVAQEQEEDDHGADEFEFYACVNGIESDEEEALHEELDKIEAQAERSDELGMTPHKLAAAAFLKASTNLMMISESFALLRSLFINTRFGGGGLNKFLLDDEKNGGKLQSKLGDVGKAKADEDPDEQMVTQYDIIRVMDVLQVDVSNDDIDAIVEEAETYALSHQTHLKPGMAAARSSSAGNPASNLTSSALVSKGLSSADTAVPLSAVLAGSQTFRMLVCDMNINHELCVLLESRLGEVLTEQQMEQLEVIDERVVKEGDLLHPSLDNNGEHFFVVRHGFFTATHPDAAIAAPPKGQPGNKKQSRHLLPVHVKKGDVFGAYRALRSGHVEREVAATSDAIVLVISCSSLLAIIDKDPALSVRVLVLMAEGPRVHGGGDDEKAQPRGLLARSASLRKVREGIKGAFNRTPSATADGDIGRSPSANSNGSETAMQRLGGWVRRTSSPASDDKAPRKRSDSPRNRGAQSPRGGKAGAWGAEERAAQVGEVQRRGLSETMAMLEDLWNCLSMGFSFIARPLLEVVGQTLGEASSHAFMQVFFPVHRELDHLLIEEEFWRCWLAFTAEQGLEDSEDEDLQEATDKGPRRRRKGGDDDDESDVGDDDMRGEEVVKERESLFESLFSRFSPTRSLSKHFFEPEKIDLYEPAYLQITGDLKQPLPVDKVPELLSSIFIDLPFRISKHNAREFLVAFSHSERGSSEGVLWSDIRSVLKKRRMTVQDHEHGLLLNNALDPRSKPYRVWGHITMLVATYYLATVPVRAAFLPWDSMLHTLPLATDLPVDILATVNFVLSLNTAYRNRRSAWVTSRYRIAKKLPLSLWASALPLDWLAWMAGADNEVCCFLRLPRMALMLAKSRFGVQTRDKGVRSQIERMLSMVALTLHFSACVWFFLGRSYHRWVSPDWAVSWYYVDESLQHMTFSREAYGWKPSSTVWDQYLFSVHWVAATLTVNGLVGPVIPQNGVELVFTILLMVLNMTLFRWIIGEISSIIMNADVHMVKRREEYAQYRSFIESNHLPDDLRDEIMAHFNASHRDSMVAQGKILAGLCASLQVDRARFLYREIVGNITMLGGCSDSFLDALCVVVQEVHFNPEEPLFENNAPASHLFMIVTGSVETFMQTAKGEIKDGEYDEGSAAGTVAFFFDTKHMHMGRAGRGGCTSLRLNRTQFSDIVLLFPGDEAIIASNVLTQLKKQNKAMSMGYAHSVTFSVGSRGARSAMSRGASSRGGEMSSMAGSRMSKGNKSAFGESSKKSAFDPDVDGDADGGGGGGGSDSSEGGEGPSEEERKAAVSQSKKFKNLLAGRKTRFVHMLLSAAHAGDAQKVEEVLTGTSDVAINDADVMGRTALHVAASEGHVEVVEYLVASGADVTVQDKAGNTPLNDAVRHHHDAVAGALRDKFPWLKLKLKEPEAAETLCKMAQSAARNELQRLVDNGVNVNAVNVDGRTALMVAACQGDVAVVELLMQSKADPDMADKWGKTAMAGAIAEDRREVQEMLRSWGVKHGKGEMELTVATCEVASTNDVKTMRVMVKNGVDPSLGDYDMRTPMHLAASNQCLTALEFLLNFDPPINVNPIDRFGGTPLEDAYRHNNTAAIELLEARGGLRKDDPSQSKAMAMQVAELQAMQKKQRQPTVDEAASRSLEAQALRALGDVVVPTVTKNSTRLILSLTKVLEGFKAVMRAGQRQKSGPLAGTAKARHKWTSVLEANASRNPLGKRLSDPGCFDGSAQKMQLRPVPGVDSAKPADGSDQLDMVLSDMPHRLPVRRCSAPPVIEPEEGGQGPALKEEEAAGEGEEAAAGEGGEAEGNTSGEQATTTTTSGGGEAQAEGDGDSAAGPETAALAVPDAPEGSTEAAVALASPALTPVPPPASASGPNKAAPPRRALRGARAGADRPPSPRHMSSKPRPPGPTGRPVSVSPPPPPASETPQRPGKSTAAKQAEADGLVAGGNFGAASGWESEMEGAEDDDEEMVVVGGNFGAPTAEGDAEGERTLEAPPADGAVTTTTAGREDLVRGFGDSEDEAELPGMASVHHLPRGSTPLPPRERKIKRSIPSGQEVEFPQLEDGLDKVMELLKEMKLVIITIRRHIAADDAGDVEDEAEAQPTEVSKVPMDWMRESRAWLLVSKRYRAGAAIFKRQLSVCMLKYKLARRVIKEVRRLLQRSRVHENQVRARGRRKSSTAYQS